MVTYQPGKSNRADYLSRHPSKTTYQYEPTAEEHVNFIINNAVPKSLTTSEIQIATKNDALLQSCIKAVTTNTWKTITAEADAHLKADLASVYHVRDELSVNDTHDIILRDHRIVIPKSLQQRVIDLAHEGHQGIVKTKQLLRQKVWFPGIDRMVEHTISQCLPCQATTVETSTSEPLRMSALPTAPWSHVSIDFKDLPTGDYLLVVIDDYSRYPEIEIVSSTSAKSVIPKLDRIFATFGCPQVVRTDNGPPFQSAEFAAFAKYIGFTHRKVTPFWPQANGEVERMMRNLKKVYRTAKAENRSWKQAMYAYLRNYRSTPHSTTGVSPASLLFKHTFRTRLPELAPTPTNPDLVAKDSNMKECMKTNADNNRAMRKYKIKVGDVVLVKQTGIVSNSMTPYQLQPLKVTMVKGSMITATRDDNTTITRNASFFKRLKQYPHMDATPPPDYDPNDSETEQPIANPEVPPEPPRRNPPRDHRLPEHLRDFVLGN